MEPVDWEQGGWMRALGMLLKGDAPEIRDRLGRHVEDDDFVLLLNTHSEPVDFKLPEAVASWDWKVAVDSARPELEPGAESVQNAELQLAARSFVVMVHER